MRITADEALQRIQGTTGMKRAKGAQLSLLRSISQTRRERVYLFSSGTAVKVCPADDALPAVLAEYEMGEDTPPALNNWLLGYAREVKWYQEQGMRAAAKVMKAPAKTAAAPILIEPLLGDIKWGQRAPFWNNIKYPNPNKTTQRVYCYVGCVATAMAMVMYYWFKKGRRRGCRATSAYTTKTYSYAVGALPFMEMFDWENMTDVAPTTTIGKAAVAELSEYMGKIVSMDYGPWGSSAKMAKVSSAFKNFLYVPTAERLEMRYTTSSKFKARIIADLQKGWPVIMSGGSSSVTGAHCFVCDGYDSSTDLFHFNWGSYGDGDGWYALTALTPNDFDFTTQKNAILGVFPPLLGDVNADGKINMSDVTAAINAQKNYTVAADVNFDGKVDDEDTNKIINTILGKEKL